MDKLHKIQLKALIQSYQDQMDLIESHEWYRLENKQSARASIVQFHFEELCLLLADQEKIFD